MKDREVIPLLHDLDRPTFFTLDTDYFDRRLRHEGYCLVYLDVRAQFAAEYIRRVLRHRQLNTKARRMGLVVRAHPDGLDVWRVREKEAKSLSWD